MLREWWSCCCRWVSWRGCLFSVAIAGVKKNGSKVTPYSHSVQNRSSLEMSGENVAEKREEKSTYHPDMEAASFWYPNIHPKRSGDVRLSRTSQALYVLARWWIPSRKAKLAEAARPATPQHQPHNSLTNRGDAVVIGLNRNSPPFKCLSREEDRLALLFHRIFDPNGCSSYYIRRCSSCSYARR